MRHFGSVDLILAALLASMTLATEASGQALEAPPVRSHIDENGVDLSSGQVVIASTDIGIGGFEGLFESRYQGASYGSNHTIYVITDFPTRQVVISDSRTNYEPQGSNTWLSSDGGRLTLDSSGNYTLITTSGVTYQLTKPTSIRCMTSLDTCNHAVMATQIAEPDGHITNIEYGTNGFCELDEMSTCLIWQIVTRIERIWDNRGLELRFFYGSNEQWNYYNNGPWEVLVRISAINRAKAYCPPYPDQCLAARIDKVDYSIESANPNSIRVTTDELGRQTRYTYNGVGRLVSVQLPGYADPSIHYIWNSVNKLIQVLNNGVSSTYGFVENRPANEFTATKTSGGSSETFVFGLGNSNLKRYLDAAGNEYSFTYDTLGRLATATEPEGNQVTITRDSRGNVTQLTKTAKPGSGLAAITTTASFDTTCVAAAKCNKPNYIIDARGNRTDFTYDSTHGGLTRIQFPAPVAGQARPEVNLSYQASYGQERDSGGSLVNYPSPIVMLTGLTQCASAATCPASPNETRIAYEYLSPNLLVTRKSASSGDGTLVAASSFAYNGSLDLASINGPLSGSADTTHFIYDVLHRRRGVISPDPDGSGSLPRRAERYTFDAAGRVSKIDGGTVSGTGGAALDAMSVAQTIDATFDNDGRRVRETLSGGGVTHSVLQFGYDAKGRLQCTARRMNPAAFTSPPVFACSLGPEGAFGPDRITKVTYDANDRPTLVQTGYGSAGQANEAAYTYTANGQLATLKDAENNLTTYEYDGFDRPLRTLFPVTTKGGNASSTIDFEELGYDANGNVISRRLRDGTNHGYTYDALNRLKHKALPETDVSFTYDNLSRLTLAAKGVFEIVFTYDALSRVTSTASYLTSTLSPAIIYEYDLAGRRTKLTYPGSGLYLEYDYLVTGEVTKIRENGATSGIGVLATFAYDDLGRRTGLTFGNGASQSYSYDGVSRLSSLTANLSGTADDLTIVNSSYNPASQIVGQTRSNDAYAFVLSNETTASAANGLNQLTSIGGSATDYDNRGNLTLDPTTGKIYGYNSENMLISASGAGSPASLPYDALMRLREVAGAATTRFAYDGLDMIAEYNASNALQRRYVFGPGSDEPLVWYEGSGTSDRRFLHADERGSIVAVSDASGNVLAKNSYDEFGKPAASNNGRFQYTGQAWLKEIGVQYSKARMYDPALGRFLQTDPIGYAAGPNLYAYVLNDPINFSDPLGLECIGDSNIGTEGEDCRIYVTLVQDQWDMRGILESLHSAFNDAEVASNFTIQLAALAPESLDEIVVRARRTRRLGAYRIDFSLVDEQGDPVEQFFRVDNGVITEIKIPTRSYNCGGIPSRGADLSVAAAGADQVIHTHPFGLDPFPGPRDWVIPRRWRIPLYGISPIGVWRINPGPPIAPILLSGSWGRFDRRSWTRLANRSARGPRCTVER